MAPSSVSLPALVDAQEQQAHHETLISASETETVSSRKQDGNLIQIVMVPTLIDGICFQDKNKWIMRKSDQKKKRSSLVLGY